MVNYKRLVQRRIVREIENLKLIKLQQTLESFTNKAITFYTPTYSYFRNPSTDNIKLQNINIPQFEICFRTQQTNLEKYQNVQIGIKPVVASEWFEKCVLCIF